MICMPSLEELGATSNKVYKINRPFVAPRSHPCWPSMLQAAHPGCLAALSCGHASVC